MHKFIEVFHFLPLYFIIAIFAGQFLWRTFRKEVIVIKQLDPLLLILSAIGTAAGTSAHGTEIAQELFDPCFGYAVVSLCVAARMLGFFNKGQKLVKA